MAIKLLKKRAVESRTNRAMPIRKLGQVQDKELMKSLPPPIKGQINEFAITVLGLCVKRYSKLIGPNHVKTLKASKKLGEMEASIMPDFGLDDGGGGGDTISVGFSTFQEGQGGWYGFLHNLFFNPKNRRGQGDDDGGSNSSGSINKLLVSTMSIGAMKKVYPIDDDEEDYQGNQSSGEMEEGLGGSGGGFIYGGGGGLGMIKGGGHGGNRIFPVIDEDGGGDA